MSIPPLDPEIAAIYEGLRRAYFADLPRQVEALVHACSRARTWGSGERADARERAHQIGGSARVFGAAALGQEALALEDLLAATRSDDRWHEELQTQLASLARVWQELGTLEPPELS